MLYGIRISVLCMQGKRPTCTLSISPAPTENKSRILIFISFLNSTFCFFGGGKLGATPDSAHGVPPGSAPQQSLLPARDHRECRPSAAGQANALLPCCLCGLAGMISERRENQEALPPEHRRVWPKSTQLSRVLPTGRGSEAERLDEDGAQGHRE